MVQYIYKIIQYTYHLYEFFVPVWNELTVTVNLQIILLPTVKLGTCEMKRKSSKIKQNTEQSIFTRIKQHSVHLRVQPMKY